MALHTRKLKHRLLSSNLFYLLLLIVVLGLFSYSTNTVKRLNLVV